MFIGAPFILLSSKQVTGSTLPKRAPLPLYRRDEKANPAREKATPADAFDARMPLLYPDKQLSPPGGYFSAPVPGAIIGVCSFEEDGELTEVTIYPVTLLHEPRPQCGRPMLADEEMAPKIIEYLGDLSKPYGTEIAFKDGVGQVKL